MELLIFHMGGRELFGLSVLEVREIMARHGQGAFP